MQRIAVIGTGYVGLVTGTCLAETGNKVICVDINEEKVKQLQNEIIPIFEPGLDVYFHRNIRHGRLRFTTDLKDAIDNSELIFFCLPTPPDEDGSADLSHILNAANDVAKLIKDYKIIINKSTVPVGTAARVEKVFSIHLDKDMFDVVSNPEFLREGAAVDDFMKPERVVVGTSSARAKDKMENLYTPFVRQGNPIIFMDVRSAELTKYAANAFLATKISYMNEIANLCDKVGANVDMVRIGLGTDSRIGKRFLFPGVGYGGSCFPKDVQALNKTAEIVNYDFKILDAVMDVNQKQKLRIAEAIKLYFGNDLGGLTIAIWGLAFKPNTDDLREAPAIYTIDALLDAGAQIKAYDPEGMKNYKIQYGNNIELCSDHYQTLQDADALAILTEWNLFRTPDFQFMKMKMKRDLIFDGRNVFDLETMEENQIEYYSIGRPVVNESKKASLKNNV